MRTTADAILWRPGRSAFRGIAWIGAGVAWAAAALVGVLLALFFAATVVVSLMMAGALLAFAAAAARARRAVRRSASSDVIEARQIGGHSWVAYGWDSRR